MPNDALILGWHHSAANKSKLVADKNTDILLLNNNPLSDLWGCDIGK